MTLQNAGFPQTKTLAGARWRETSATVLGVLGASAVALAASGDYLGRSAGAGPVEWTLYSGGAASVGAALLLRYGSRAQLADGLRFLALIAQAILLFLLVNHYQIESDAFHKLMFILVMAGFVANHFLPAAARPYFFLTLSFVAMFAVLGVQSGLALLAIGLGLIGICHLPLPLSARIALLLVVATGLALVRAGVLPGAWLVPVLPLVGSIFMFRLVVYLYDLRNGKGPANPALRLSYFFMLPNFVFPFFPVVDFTAWGRGFATKPELETYQRGMMWCLIGALHLILYRLVNNHLSFDAESVNSFAGFLWYAVTNFGLYLKISGLFHLILGCLFLFGFSLPETHSRFYLSFSLVEFWRRINIYWKDFMQKMVFNPSYAWLKRRKVGHEAAMIASISIVFVITWALHAYQWFWLRGTALMTAPDILFWTLLGALLIAQTVLDGRPRRAGAVALIGPRTLHALRVASTMLLIVILWSMWSSDSMADWFALLSRSGLPLLSPEVALAPGSLLSSLAFVAFLVIITAVAIGLTFGLAPAGAHPSRSALAGRPAPFRFAPQALLVAGVCSALLAVQNASVNSVLPREARVFIVDMGEARLSHRDQQKLTRGYYENLTDVRMINSDLWALQNPQADTRRPIQQTDAVQFVDDYRSFILKPDLVTTHLGGLMSSNSFGMRDKDYTVAKPEGTRRIALMGDSRAMGIGVSDDQTFEAVLETRLVQKTGDLPPVEVLNFGFLGFDPFQKTIALGHSLDFAPDVALYVSHDVDLEIRAMLADYIADGGSPAAYLEAPLAAAGIVPGGDRAEIRAKLDAVAPSLVKIAYAEFAATARAAGAVPVWVFLPSTQRYAAPVPQAETLKAFAVEAGFEIIDLTDIYSTLEGDVKALWVAPWDDHPNWKGHDLIAQRLETELLALPAVRLALGR